MSSPDDLARLVAQLTPDQQHALLTYARRLLTGGRHRGEPRAHLRADGRWQIALELPSATGKRQRRVIYGRTEKEAQAAYRAAQRKLEASGGVQAPARLTVDGYLDGWLRDVATVRLAPATLEEQAGVLSRYIRPQLGGRRLAQLTPQDVQQALARLSASGLHPNTVRNAHVVFRAALAVAVRQRLLPHNPTDGVALPRGRRTERRSLTVAEAQAVLRAARGDPLEALWVLALLTGLRQGELLALRWADCVDLDGDSPRLVQARSVRRMRGRWVFKEPKTPSGIRVVPLVAPAVVALHRHRMRSDAIDGLVFHHRQHPLWRDRVLDRWARVQRAAGVERLVTMHAIRHSTASLLIALGVPWTVTASILGHADTSMLAKVYGHEIDGEAGRRAALERLAVSLAVNED